MIRLGPPAARHLLVVAGLPPVPAPFDPRHEPAGPFRLDRHLRPLDPNEHAALRDIRAGVDRWALANLDDETVLARACQAHRIAPARPGRSPTSGGCAASPPSRDAVRRGLPGRTPWCCACRALPR